jgi:hypothetical protein
MKIRIPLQVALVAAWCAFTPARADTPTPTTTTVTLTVPTWSFGASYDLSNHNAAVLAFNTIKSYSFPKVKGLSALAVSFAGTELQTSGSTASQGLTGGFGGELMYQVGKQSYLDIGIGEALYAGALTHTCVWFGGAVTF